MICLNWKNIITIYSKYCSVQNCEKEIVTESESSYIKNNIIKNIFTYFELHKNKLKNI